MPFEDLAPAMKELLRQKSVNVKAVGAQKGNDRFRKEYEHRPEQIPAIREWRLNLTRLSQTCNLLLVAYVDKIYIYKPDYPSQELPQKPALILSPPKTPSAGYGYLDRECPHSINHLLVDFLGNLEVVLIACDDGDVIGYYINDLDAAVARRFEALGPRTVLGDEVRPFFMRNVQLSAWGLSIHSEARKIAISSNTHKVTVVSLGLQDHESHGDIRYKDHTFVVPGFHNNLPSVTFCNTKDDPLGRILISGEISGLIYVHDLVSLNCTEIMQVGFCHKISPGNPRCDCANRTSYPHSVWCLSFIDRRAFRKVHGYAPDPLTNAQFAKHWNGSSIKHCVPNSNNKYKLRRARMNNQSNAALGDSSNASDDDDEDEDEGLDNDDELFSDVLLTHQPGDWHASLESISHPWHASEHSLILPRMIAQTAFTSSKKFHHTRWASPPPGRGLEEHWKYIPCPLIITSKNDICLLQPEDREGKLSPVIALDDPLHQAYEYGDQNGVKPSFTQAAVNRMSLHQVIPELGVLIVGSPNGRVAIHSLLRTDDWESRQDGTYFNRLDWFLPFASQEAEGLRPERKLLGLAAGPMQGQLGSFEPEVRRRWRLMLYYADHSILSYEISLQD